MRVLVHERVAVSRIDGYNMFTFTICFLCSYIVLD